MSETEFVQADPAQKTTDTVAHIELHNGKVCMTSGKDDIIIRVCKEYGLKWNWGGRSWDLEIELATSESIEDRAAELGNRMLCAGVPIVMRRPLLDMAVSGAFEPHTKRWVSVYKDERVFRVKTDGDETYQAAKLLPKARYEHHAFSVPYECWKDVEDFATLLGYKLSDGAKAALEELHALTTTRIVVNPVKVERKEKRLSEALAGVLESSREVLEDLVDDD